MRANWFIVLISAICLEGLGRKYLPMVPAPAFYFFKDLVLAYGYLRFRPPPAVQRSVRWLYRGFEVFFFASFAWTLIELFNPEHKSLALGLIGLRAYWVWWAAPPVLASALQNRKDKDRAIYAISMLSIGITALAAVQFASPADSAVNLYSLQDGQEVYASDMATVASTGRARVPSTFTFVSGFVAFTLTMPTLLLSLGLDSENARVRRIALVATFASAATIPMSGSRGAIVIGVAVLGIAMWSAGLFFTRIGRRVLIGSVVAAILSVVAFPDAMFGVESRFGSGEETAGRLHEVANLLPPVALFAYDYPMLGTGTGMQQNSRASMHISDDWEAESEMNKYLIELGPIGFILFWCAKLGLMVALLRAYKVLKTAGRRGASGAALTYAAMTMVGSLTFDHNWQALYFTGCGFTLAEFVAVRRQQTAGLAPAPEEAPAPARMIADPQGATGSA